MTNRVEIVAAVKNALLKISRKNQNQTNFSKVTYWQDTPSEYGQNHLNFRDEEENYKIENQRYKAELDLYIEAIVVETEKDAAELGTLALLDLIGAVKSLSLCGALFELVGSSKWVETKGKTACLVELKVKVKYKIER